MVRGIEKPSGSTPSEPPHQIETGMQKSFHLEGNTAMKKWFRKSFPGMSDAQLDKAVNQFLLSIMQDMQRTINTQLKHAKEAARKLKKSEEGEPE